MGLLVGFTGFGGRLTSSGMYSGVERAAEAAGWDYEVYSHIARVAPAELIRRYQGQPIVLVGNSMGVDAIDAVLEANPDIKVDVVFAVVSAFGEDFPVNAEKIIRVVATGDHFRNFALTGRKVTTLEIDASHLSADDSPVLWREVRTVMNAMNNSAATPQFDSVLDLYDAEWAAFMNPDNEDKRDTLWFDAFFGVVRAKILRPLNQDQVNGLKTMIFVWRKLFRNYPVEFFADTAGQSVRETGGRLVAVRETFAATEAQVLSRLQNFWDSGKARAFGVRRQYWLDDGIGHPYGRGILQLTLPDNYANAEKLLRDKFGIIVDLDGDYDLALDPLVSAIVAFAGMQHGIFRGGRKQSNYLRDGVYDFYNARDIVNGDKTNRIAGGTTVGREIEADSKAFLEALKAAEAAVPGWISSDYNIVPDALPAPDAGGEGDVLPPVAVDPGLQQDVTLNALRGLSTQRLHSGLSHAADLIKLSMIVLEEREAGGSTPINTINFKQPAMAKENEMNTTKNLFNSTGFLGGLIAVLSAVIAVFFGIDVPEELQNQMLALLMSITGAGGLAAYGRVTATDTIQSFAGLAKDKGGIGGILTIILSAVAASKGIDLNLPVGDQLAPLGLGAGGILGGIISVIGNLKRKERIEAL